MHKLFLFSTLHYSRDLTTYITVEMCKFPRSLVELEPESSPLNERYLKLKGRKKKLLILKMEYEASNWYMEHNMAQGVNDCKFCI